MRPMKAWWLVPPGLHRVYGIGTSHHVSMVLVHLFDLKHFPELELRNISHNASQMEAHYLMFAARWFAVCLINASSRKALA